MAYPTETLKTHETILGLNLDGATLHVGKVRQERLISRTFRRLASGASEDMVLEEIFAAIDQVIDDKVIGIGFGAPSIVDTDRGIVYSVENIPSWRKVYLKDLLEKRYEVPAYVNNDANAFVVGELYFGLGRGHKDLVGVIVGTGLGLGLVFDGRLCCGSNCGAGEIGRIPYLDGEFEDYCSRKLFDRESTMQELLLRGRAERGDAEARRFYNELGTHLGRVLQMIVYAYDPEIVIFGGSLCEAFPLYRGAMMETMSSCAYQRTIRRLVVTATENKTNGLVLGAAALYLDSVKRRKTNESGHA